MLRYLRELDGGVDLCSNDYLGIARRLSPPAGIAEGGATGSRLVSGTTHDHLELEGFLATCHQTEAALLFGSGYEANLGLLSALGTRHDTIIYDDLIHASLRDGIRLSAARSFSFRHNDLDDLRRKMSAARGECYIVVESVYSMDGDIAPMTELCKLARSTGAFLIVDEAHSTGVYGGHGEGLVQDLGLQGDIFARVHTFGKALGYRGACVVGSALLRDYLINFSRPFIYSTAPDLHSLAMIRQAYERAREATSERARLRALIEHLRALRARYPEIEFLDSATPIQGVIIGDNEEAIRVESALRSAGIHARAIRAPTVPSGTERIRLCLHSFNTEFEIEQAILAIAETLGERRARHHAG